MKEQKNDGGPAFPFKCQGQTTGPEFYYGMSLRDWFAGMALSGQISFEGMEGCNAEHIAACGYEVADAMLKERLK